MKTKTTHFNKALFTLIFGLLAATTLTAADVNWEAGIYLYDRTKVIDDNITLTGNVSISVNKHITVTINGSITGGATALPKPARASSLSTARRPTPEPLL